VRLVLADLAEQPIAPEAAIDQHQVVAAQRLQQRGGDGALAHAVGGQFEPHGEADQGELEQEQAGLRRGQPPAVLGVAGPRPQIAPPLEFQGGSIQGQEAERLEPDQFRVFLLEAFREDQDQGDPEGPGHGVSGLGERGGTDAERIAGPVRIVFRPRGRRAPAGSGPGLGLGLGGVATQGVGIPGGVVAHQFQGEGQDGGETPRRVQGAGDGEPDQDEQAQGAGPQRDAGAEGGLLDDLAGHEGSERPKIAVPDLVPYGLPVMIDEHRGSPPEQVAVDKQLMSESAPRYQPKLPAIGHGPPYFLGEIHDGPWLGPISAGKYEPERRDFWVPRVPYSEPVRHRPRLLAHGFRVRNPWHPADGRHRRRLSVLAAD